MQASGNSLFRVVFNMAYSIRLSGLSCVVFVKRLRQKSCHSTFRAGASHKGGGGPGSRDLNVGEVSGFADNLVLLHCLLFLVGIIPQAERGF